MVFVCYMVLKKMLVLLLCKQSLLFHLHSVYCLLFNFCTLLLMVAGVEITFVPPPDLALLIASLMFFSKFSFSFTRQWPSKKNKSSNYPERSLAVASFFGNQASINSLNNSR